MSAMPSPTRLLGACAAACLTALLSLAAAGVAGTLVASSFDDGSFLSGLLEGAAAAVLVAVGGVPASAWMLRRVAGAGGRMAPGWGWAIATISAGIAGAIGICAAGSAAGDESLLVPLAVTLSPLAAIGTGWGLLMTGAARGRAASSRGDAGL